MRKIDLLHTTILIVAILCGYAALRELLGVLNATFYASDIFYARSGYGAFILPSLIEAGGYVVACIVLIRNSERIAVSMLGNSRPEYEEFLEGEEPSAAAPEMAEEPDQLEWKLDRMTVLYVFFIGLGLYTLIEYIPDLLNSVIGQFKTEVSGALRLVQPERRNYRDYLLLDALRATIGALLIYAAPTLTNFIERTISIRLQPGSKK
ncbi:MAG TPA: hypothetical protein VMH27_11980 [Puia sp.]|nr:hypothetical protein [Puia sp.]